MENKGQAKNDDTGTPAPTDEGGKGLGAVSGSACPYCEEGYINVTDSCGSKMVLACGWCNGTGEVK